MKPTGEKVIASGSAQRQMPSKGPDVAPGKPSIGSAGPERKAETAKAINSKPSSSNPLSGAVGELHKQHPHKHYDHGPHHGKLR